MTAAPRRMPLGLYARVLARLWLAHMRLRSRGCCSGSSKCWGCDGRRQGGFWGRPFALRLRRERRLPASFLDFVMGSPIC